MNPKTITALLLLTLGAAPAVVAQETNAPAALDWSSFQSIAQKNIFDPTRGPGGERFRSRPRPRVIRVFSFLGTIDDAALFTGDGAGRGYLKAGDMINGFKVMEIPVSYTDALVVLTDPAGTIVNLRQGESMRREEDGPWAKSDEPAPAPEPVAGAPSLSPSTSAPETGVQTVAEPVGLTGAAREIEILKRLRQKREQEEK